MANSSSAYFYNKGFRTNNNQWNEKCERQNIESTDRMQMTNIFPLAPENDRLLSKPPQNNSPLKSSSFNGKKCQVYVHHFNKIPSKSSNNYFVENNWRSGSEIHQNLYKHEFSDFYDTKIRTLKKQFDNLSLQSVKKPQTSGPYKFSKGYKHPTQERIDRFNQLSKSSYAKSTINGKLDKSILFKPEHKAIVDKLEESYWAKWKPNNKHSTNNELHPKMKGLYTENEKIKVNYQNNNCKKGRKERGDSNNSIIPPEKDERPNNNTDNNLIYVDNSEQKEIHLEEVQQEEEEEEELETYEKEEESSDIIKTPVENAKEVIMLSDPSCFLTPDSDVDCEENSLKHTDSFILTSKKQGQEKSPYQQPKCIKLFKNSDYTTTTQTNYIKSGTRGGSYPLKSCLKKESSQKSNHLGRPGSPIKITTRRFGKPNRFNK